MQDNKRLHIPSNELLFINPEPRKRLFLDMIEEYKKRIPSMKLIYAYLNYDSSLGIDYLIVFEAIGAKYKMPFIRYDAPYIYTDRAIPGYRYCKREDMLNDFFSDANKFMVTMPKHRFNEFINSIDLSTEKCKDEYWASPKNSDAFVNKLSELSLYYNRKD